MKLTFYTYMHLSRDTGSVFYVGKGCKKRAWDFSKRNPKWKNFVAKHGVKVEICAHWPSEIEALEHEKFLIACMKDVGLNLSNLADGGNGPTGYRYTEAQKKKMSASRTGKIHSQATKEKISKAQAGIPRAKASAETKAKMSAAHAGRPRTSTSDETKKKISANNGSRRPEVKAKISASLLGKKLEDQQKKKISSALKGIPKNQEHRDKIRLARLAYFEEQRRLHGKSQSITEQHKLALRHGYNKILEKK